MRNSDIDVLICEGDGTASVNMVDGGVMALSEIKSDDIRLESELGDNEPFFSPDQMKILNPELFKGLK